MESNNKGTLGRIIAEIKNNGELSDKTIARIAKEAGISKSELNNLLGLDLKQIAEIISLSIINGQISQDALQLAKLIKTGTDSTSNDEALKERIQQQNASLELQERINN